MTREAPLNKLICYWASSANPTPTHRSQGWGIPENGWIHFTENAIQKSIDIGFKRIWMHNPFGSIDTIGEDMDYDQLLEAEKAGLKWPRKDFVKAWKKITKQVEVVSYMGAISTDSDLTKLDSVDKADNWFLHAVSSIQPCLNAKMSIGFDALHYSGTQPNFQDIYTGYLFQLILQKKCNVRTYIEPWPNKAMKSWPDIKDQNFITTAALMNHRSPSWAMDESELSGEKVTMLTSPELGPWSEFDRWIKDWCWREWDANRSVCVSLTDWWIKNIKPADFFRIQTSIVNNFEGEK